MVICEFEDGARAKLRHVTVGCIVRDKAGALLLVKRADWLKEGGKWAYPGGYLDPDEDAHTAAQREVLEETGYETTDLQLFRVITHGQRRNDERQNVEFCFLATAGDKVGKPDTESTEQAWVATADISVDDMAFDHGQILALYERHLTEPLALPLVD